MSMGPEEISQFAASLGSLAFAVWFAYHTTTKTLPDLHSTHKAERDSMMTRFENNLDKIMTTHEATVAQMTKHCEEEIQVVVNAFSAGKTHV